jgi:hypothetical protein
MENPNFILIDDDKIMLLNLKLKNILINSSIKSYFKSDVAFNFIHDNFSELENTVLLLDLKYACYGFSIRKFNFNFTY